ncbi:MAG TPA: bifunctional DNA-formamidopyrimidine glycosylase/DNA-(apurinic or apyrimidinic site) lyase [Acidimicrobiia bacterium]|nr:bifunctional DNA-formamidopyrimidine glycosylase/DNA-(apurinic or apyrimidinic site) lyase [Acidimicrobiia bacterium]
MPELPEVESIRRHLEPVLTGRRVTKVEVFHPRTVRRNVAPSDVVDRLTGAVVKGLRRHGKFLLADLDRDLTWVIHLGMSGRILVAPGQLERPPHTHFVATIETGDEVRFVDPRTFGFVAVLTPDELVALAGLGPDALITLPRTPDLVRRLSGRRAPIKALLLDQRILAGLGNIYADEVLHRAGVRPTRPGGQVSTQEMSRMRAAIRPVLNAGIAAGGTSLADLSYLLPDGQAGDNLRRLRVYGREGEMCRHCGAIIERVVVAGRSSYFCPSCQT